MAYSKPEPLRDDDDSSAFDSGQPALDDWLKRRALDGARAGTARTFVTKSEGRIVGYFALAAASVASEDATERALKGQPAERAVPAVLLARLAVDREHQGRGVGRSLLQDALLRALQVAEHVGVRVVIVHAKDEAAREWYGRFGFEESPTDPLHLILLMKDLRALVGKMAE